MYPSKPNAWVEGQKKITKRIMSMFAFAAAKKGKNPFP